MSRRRGRGRQVEKVDISGLNWDEVDWDAMDWATVDWSQLSGDQKTRLRGIKKEVMKKQKEADRIAKEARQEAHRARLAAQNVREKISWEGRFDGSSVFGDLPRMMSQFPRDDARFVKMTPVSAVGSALVGETVVVRARLHTKRSQSKDLLFLVLRDGYSTVQAILNTSTDGVTRRMLKYGTLIGKESIIELEGVVVAVDTPTRTTNSDVEIRVSKLFVFVAASYLPLLVEDAMMNDEEMIRRTESRRTKKSPAAAAAAPDAAAAAAAGDAAPDGQERFGTPAQNVRLDYRYLDLRAPAHKAIFRISSGVGQLFREFLYSQGFTEIHSPKMISTASEGGAEVFKVEYFNTNAYLAQSPQLYKQMAIMCDFDRVFEIGPVFRAENSNTNRHLTEFTGMDIEMKIERHYHEVLDVLDGLMCFIFEGLKTRFARELAVIQSQYPFEPIAYETERKNLVLPYSEGVAMLREAGHEMSDTDDLSTEGEKLLGRLVKEKFGTDFYMLDKYPMAVRPFYTMPDADNPKWSNSYDLFIRGEEITSGAQRIHDPEMLLEKAREKDVDLTPIIDYVRSFKYGAWPHGGAGIGLERVVMLYLGLPNIRKGTMFPRDPKRLTP